MSDMSSVIVPKSDQLNADDLIAGPLTIEVSGVTIRPGQEQPISISYVGDKGKPYKACKSMCRVMVTAWGADSKRYTGRSMTLYRDPAVKWGGLAVGGIRISHMSDIDAPLTLALTETRASRKPFTVRPLVAPKASAASQRSPSSDPPSAGASASAADRITDDQIATLESRCTEHGIPIDRLKAVAKVDRLADIAAADFDRANGWVSRAIDKLSAHEAA